MTEKIKQMIEEFQCPGCVCGSDTSCIDLYICEDVFVCKRHRLGTITQGGKFALGLPKGFCKEGYDELQLSLKKPSVDKWNKLNIPVWAMEKSGCLFVKTISPRINRITVSIYKDAKISDIKSEYKPIDVSDFYEEID